MEILKIKNLTKYYKVEKIFFETNKIIKAVDDVSFSLKEGEILAIVGESGSGKTTVARCISGLEDDYDGEILYKGSKIDYDNKNTRREIQYIFQDTDSSLNPRMKIRKILEEPLRFHFGIEDKKQLKNEVINYLIKVGLSSSVLEKYPHELSGGQRQRILIARTLTMNPKLLIADEPVSSLDVSVQAKILKLFLNLNKHMKKTIIFITHDLRIVKNLADRVVVMKNGRIIEEGNVKKIYTKPKTNYTKMLLDSIPV